ncbi:uncharacterized protein LOC110699276 [Chenopodium quinoa]|uniref:uncharacterized protein LOC110699276 n=1 Tax=Chenopodium quinoa TaxID=63459 RepID=UPI000B773762|nr:uncharacterized protein LOC110699276 [Chenopodium quinoa]XP_021732467.1 uncharacterized protein LOC110699276 [Chenopodium quinoa]XP_021732468.1 uncharacterized protein LOC110699276 [Chenopodium quinoa]
MCLVGIRKHPMNNFLVGPLLRLLSLLIMLLFFMFAETQMTQQRRRNKLDDYLDIFKNLCDIKKVQISGKILTGKSIRKSLVSEAKGCAAAAVIVGITKPGSIGGRMSTAKYCAKQLPLSTEIFTVHNGKVLFQRLSNDDHIVQGLEEDPRSSFHKAGKSNGNQSEFGDSEVSEVDSNSSKLNCQNSESESTTDISCEELAEV